MSNDQRSATRRISMMALLGALLLAPLYGCRTVGSSWEEDRSIPFSADDRAIAYQHKGAVYVARTQGDKHRQVFESTSESAVSTPHWAPGQRGVVFAVASDARDPETALVEYELWYWPAPEDIWTSQTDGTGGDSAELPERWRPKDPRKLLSAHCRDEMQLKANALFSWHPDGSHLLFLDTDDSRLQTVWSYNMNTGAREAAAPISAASLAFSIAPHGSRLQLAAAEKGPSALWVGPMGADAGAWQRIESRPGTRPIPKMAVADGDADSAPSLLYDLRPRLGAWSPDAQWLAHTRAPTEDAGRFELVLTPLTTDEPTRVVVMPGSNTQDLHWRSGGQELAVLSDQKLLVVDPYGDAVTNLSGTLPVEGFMGWSTPGNHMAYLILAENFEKTSALLPTEHIVEWQSAQRHNLMMANADGSAPRSQFGLMNISAARWSNQSAKLSFWATHLPTVSLLPPGDPAAVLDLEKDKISWYPTDIAEYGHVGHYYLLNAQFEKAAEHYSDALQKITDGDREELPLLESQLRRWRGIARLASGDEPGARQDLSFAREHTVVAAGEDTPAAEDAASWDEDVLRDLAADRNVLST
ncbi:MAG: hypothetical protein OES38_22000, partial [Gammaproteobacteria bacterium]|nr:hypothetical protein [Gammaproteobacteria bacterium]